MDKHSAQKGAAALGGFLAGVLVLTGVIIVGLYQQQRVYRQTELKSQTTLTALTEKQREIHGLQEQLVAERTKVLASRSVGLLEMSPGPWKPMTATWYAEGGINGNGITATGKRTVTDWSVAVDPKVIPLGSIIQVKFSDGTTKVYQALDTGGAIRGGRIDIYDKSIERCFQNGVQRVQVRILIKGHEGA